MAERNTGGSSTPSLADLFTSIANAIRAKKGTTAAIKATDFPSSIQALPVLDTSDATAVAANILSGKTAYAKGAKLTGTIASKAASDLTASGATVTVPAGHYASQATKSVATATQATPSISVDSAGKITASATQTAGYVSAGTKSATKQLTTHAGGSITPTTANHFIEAGTYITKDLTITGDVDLKAENIKRDVQIFGVTGNMPYVKSPTAYSDDARISLTVGGASGSNIVNISNITLTDDGTKLLIRIGASVSKSSSSGYATANVSGTIVVNLDGSSDED